MVVEGPELFARVDPGQMENALLNLALNAKSAIDDAHKSDPGRIGLMLRSVNLGDIQAERFGLSAGNFIEISCEDNGAGMPAAVQKQIFDPFFSTRDEAGGTGLGLSMAQSFVDVSAGHIAVQSEMGRGTIFTIFIPQVSERPTEDETITPEFATQFDGQMALLVEDQEEVRAVLRRELVSLGFSVVEAEHGDEAKELVQSIDGIDLVLSDISMPGQTNGLELASFVAQKFPLTSIVLMTGQAQIDHDQSIKHPLLRKPFEQHKLIEAIQYAQIARSDYGDMAPNQ